MGIKLIAFEPKLATIGLAQLDSGNFRDRISFIGRLERPREEVLLLNGLRNGLTRDVQRQNPAVPVHVSSSFGKLHH